MEEIIKMNTVEDYSNLLGAETLHPLVNVVDFSRLEAVEHCKKNFGFYAVFYKELSCGELSYGRSRYDYQDGTLLFIGPGQTAGVNDGGTTLRPKGQVLMFHPDLLYGTSLAGRMKDFTFFSYASNEALHMSERERAIILNCFREIREELTHAIDKHSKRIVASNIEVMLNHCERFYDRQFVTREQPNRDLLARFERLLADHFSSDKARAAGLPSVQLCADKLCLSANYFGDLIKKSTGRSAQEYIQNAVVDRIKEQLRESDKPVSEIAYDLGFKYPHHLSRLFKKVTGQSPNAYRALA